MSRKSSPSRWLDRRLYVAPFYYALCLTEKDFHKELKHLKIAEGHRPAFVKHWHSDATVHYFENRKEASVSCLVCLNNWEGKEDIVIYGLLVHEAVHLWQETKDLLGEDKPGREQEAYAIQNLAQQLMRSFKEQTKK